MNHFASPSFWSRYQSLSKDLQILADKSFALLCEEPSYPSLHFKRVGRYRSVRVGLTHRALAVEVDEGLLWFWIGDHSAYERMIQE